MPRPSRFAPRGIPQHVIQRGNNRSVLFAESSDYEFFRDSLRSACQRYRCHAHAYVFMTNHVHVLITPSDEVGVGKVMQSVGVRYVQYFNDRYARTGTLWEGRYRSTLIETEVYLLACYRYIELNPVRAGLVMHPTDYPWSSYRANALGLTDPVVTAHEQYSALGSDSNARQMAYRGLFDIALPDSILNDIRLATNTRWVLGSQKFRKEVAALLGRRTEPSRAGRPVRWKDEIGV